LTLTCCPTRLSVISPASKYLYWLQQVLPSVNRGNGCSIGGNLTP